METTKNIEIYANVMDWRRFCLFSDGWRRKTIKKSKNIEIDANVVDWRRFQLLSGGWRCKAV